MAEARNPTSRPDPTAAHSIKPKRTPEERKILDHLEKVWKRPLTEQEENLALEQARMIGEL